MKNMKDLEKALMSEGSDESAMSSDMMHKAKQEVLKELMNMCKQALMDKTGGDMEEIKKVTVMAPDQEKLSEGLDMAKEMSEQMPEMDEKESDKEAMMEEKDPSLEEKEDDIPSLPGFKKKKMY